MYSVDTAIEKFKTILTSKDSWATLKDSQFVDHLATFVGWAIRQAQWATERVKQEFFLSSALDRSSIVAHAEDRNYIPRKPTPSTGIISITNTGEASIAIPIYTKFVTENDIPVVTIEATVIGSGETKVVVAEQKESAIYDFTVDEESIFYKVVIPAENSANVTDFSVYVDIQDGLGYQEWSKARLFRNSYSTSKVYDEIYSRLDQIGVMFGNGNFGMVPPEGSAVRVSAWETEGETYLAAGQDLFLVSSLYDSAKGTASLDTTISGAFTGGEEAEGTEELRQNLYYYPTYDESLVWSEDYVYFLKRRFPKILFAKAWGEATAEEMAGAPSMDFINKIFISVYSLDLSDTEASCIAALNSVNLLNRKFQWVEPVHVQFTVSVSGKVLPNVVLTDAEEDIRTILNRYYGKESEERRGTVYLSEVYKTIEKTGYFEETTGARFEISLSGDYEADKIYEMVSVDLENSTFDLEYLS